MNYFLLSPVMYEIFISSTSSPALGIVLVIFKKMFSYLNGYMVVLITISLMANDFDHLLM